jgi:hypothetical protein
VNGRRLDPRGYDFDTSIAQRACRIFPPTFAPTSKECGIVNPRALAVLRVDDLRSAHLMSRRPSLVRGMALSHRWGQRYGLVEYSFDERVVGQVFVVLSYNGFCFPQRSKPPLNLQIFISRDAFYNSTFFYEQLEFSWLIVVPRGWWSVRLQNRCGQWRPQQQHARNKHVNHVFPSLSFRLANVGKVPLELSIM